MSTATAGRGYAKGRAKRAEIIERATALFGRGGFRGSSLRDIAGEVGLSHPGLLHHFPSKELLLTAVLEHRDEVDNARVAIGDGGVDLLRQIVEVARWNAERPGIVELFTVLSAEATAPDHPAHDYFRRRYAVVLDATGTAFGLVAERGGLRPGVDPRVAASQLVALMDGLQVQWLLDREGTDMAGALNAFLDAQLLPR